MRLTSDPRHPAAASMVVGGLLATALSVPFTLTHGPTSVNEQREILGQDMLAWGLLLGVVPNVLVGYGLWRLRRGVPGGTTWTRSALAAASAALFVSAALDLLFRALGPPLLMPVLATSLVVATISLVGSEGSDRRITATLAGLALVLVGAFSLALVPQETSDGFGGYRIFGALAHALAGLLWAALGVVLVRTAPDRATRAASGTPPAARPV